MQRGHLCRVAEKHAAPVPRMTVADHDQSFWFVTCVSNPVRYRSRARLFRQFRDHIINGLGANLLTVELMVGETDAHVTARRGFHIRHGSEEEEEDDEEDSGPSPTIAACGGPPVVTALSDREIQVQVQADSVMWHKENMLNVGITHLPSTCKYVAWVDSDLEFLNRDIVLETVHQLQHYTVVQMFQNCVDMGPSGEAMQVHTSFGYCWATRQPGPHNPQKDQGGGGGQRKGASGRKGAGSRKGGEDEGGEAAGYYHCVAPPQSRSHAHAALPVNTYWHPGYAFAARIETLNALGGLFDRAVLGAGDHHMCCCFVGRGAHSMPGGLHPNYRAAVDAYQALCDRHVRKRLGYVPGTLLHGFHGSKSARGYQSRWEVLVRHQYDPFRDIKRNLHGIHEWATETHDLPHDILLYFKSRNEDCTAD